MRAELPSIYDRLDLLIRSAITGPVEDRDTLVESASLLLETIAKLDNELTEVRRALAEKDDLLESLRSAAYRDSLTGLMNRRAFDDALSRTPAEGSRLRGPAAVILLDVDHFKKVNDLYGHAAGDKVLTDVGRTLRDVLASADIVARIGGEEFCAICSNTQLMEAAQLAELVRGTIAMGRYRSDQTNFRVTASLGIAVTRGPIGPDVVSDADQALYAAKRAGRDRVFAFHNGDCRPTRHEVPQRCETTYRRFTRFLVDGLIAKIQVEDQSWHEACVLDESVTGIAVYAITPPAIHGGAELLLVYRGKPRFARVRRVVPEHSDCGARLIGLQWSQRPFSQHNLE